MNRDQIKGSFKDTAGRIQRKFGQLFGNQSQEARGVQTQAEGKNQRTAGDVTDTIGKAKDSVKETFKR